MSEKVFHFYNKLVSDKSKSLVGETHLEEETNTLIKSGLMIVNAVGRDADWKLIFVNKKMCQILDGSEAQLLGLHVTNIMPQIIAENHYKFIQGFYKNQIPKVLGK